ncbi:MAG: PA2169 family four-helix-bundle protein [Alphaproteobacteria bacterium]|nr:PA2169 family four-helix-bundle protein [Alphaproteobacteria bacterium]
MNPDTADQLKSLHTAAIDARNGYREALKDAEKPHDLASVFQEMADLHQANATELHSLLIAASEQADDNGSFMSTIHRTIMDVRALFGGLDDSVLPGLIDGEKRNISHYGDALAAVAGDDEVAAILRGERSRIAAAITKLEFLKAD